MAYCSSQLHICKVGPENLNLSVYVCKIKVKFCSSLNVWKDGPIFSFLFIASDAYDYLFSLLSTAELKTSNGYCFPAKIFYILRVVYSNLQKLII